jgi:pimeloyl-ACP methyl ester carboxylesterase
VSTSSFDGVRTAAVEGAALAYRERGQGEPVVFVHGSSSDLRTWEQQLPAIGVSYRATLLTSVPPRPRSCFGSLSGDRGPRSRSSASAR